jgi:hypothetical protein
VPHWMFAPRRLMRPGDRSSPSWLMMARLGSSRDGAAMLLGRELHSGRASFLQAAEQVAQRLGVGVECLPALSGQGHGGLLRGPVPGLFAAR